MLKFKHIHILEQLLLESELIIIGNEILSGRTQDTNTSTLANWLNSIGVSVGEVRVIPDIENIIVDTTRFCIEWVMLPYGKVVCAEYD